MFKIKYLSIFLLAVSGLAAAAAEAPSENQRPGAEARAEQRQARMAACAADPEKCRAELKARHDRWCAANPERCKEFYARIEQRMADCKSDPEKCRAQRQARFERRFKLADLDGDDMISRAEAEKVMPRQLHRFDRIDADRDGKISREEIAAARKVHFEQRHRERPASTQRPGI